MPLARCRARLLAKPPLWLLPLGALCCPAVASAYTCSAGITPVAFGVYRPADAAAKTVTGNIALKCEGSLAPGVTLLVSYRIMIGAGNSGNYTGRQMLNGTQALNYQIYRNAAGTEIWGDGLNGTTAIDDTYLLGVLAPAKNSAVYARLFTGQNVPPGSYTDTLIVTVSY